MLSVRLGRVVSILTSSLCVFVCVWCVGVEKEREGKEEGRGEGSAAVPAFAT